MITIVGAGDIFDSTVRAWVNPVNCGGVMGAGLALKFKFKFPEMYAAYVEQCKTGKLKIGTVHVYEYDSVSKRPHYIINFPTKDSWELKSELSYIKSGLASLRQAIETLEIESIAIPALGCGLGGLDWENVYDLITEILTPLKGVYISLYVPQHPA